MSTNGKVIPKFRFFRVLNAELKDSPFLIWFLRVLLIEHLLVIGLWNTFRPIVEILGPQSPPVCHEFWEQCHFYRPYIFENLSVLLWVYAIITICGLICSFRTRWRNFAIWILLLLNVLKLTFVFQDLRLVGEYHYIPTIISFSFIFFSNRLFMTKIWLVIFYFFAGLLKFNDDWLSGEILNIPWATPQLKIIGSYWAVFLELVLVWFLLSKSQWHFWFVFPQFVFFHLCSITATHWFYPSIMILLLSIFLAPSWENKPQESVPIADFKNLSLVNYLAILTFVFLQSPHQYLEGDKALTGEGKLFALTMYDGLVYFDGLYFLKTKDSFIEFETPIYFADPRSSADPRYYFSHSRTLCKNSNKLELILDIQSKRATDPGYFKIVDQTNLCGEQIDYQFFQKNSWIQQTKMPLESELNSNSFNQLYPPIREIELPIVLKNRRTEIAIQLASNSIVWLYQKRPLFEYRFSGENKKMFSGILNFDDNLIFASTDGTIYLLNTRENRLFRQKIGVATLSLTRVDNNKFEVLTYFFDRENSKRVVTIELTPNLFKKSPMKIVNSLELHKAFL